jgi:transcriptional regulator with XRE-family HTH domain
MKEDYECDIGQRIKGIRTRMQIGFRKLARDSGIAVSTLWAIETGQASPSLVTLRKIGAALKHEVKVALLEAPVSSPSSSSRASRSLSVGAAKPSRAVRKRST